MRSNFFKKEEKKIFNKIKKNCKLYYSKCHEPSSGAKEGENENENRRSQIMQHKKKKFYF